MTSADRRLAYRLARRLMPPHRKDWADAMFNETAYLSPRAARRWAVHCTLAALHERITHELEMTRMSRILLKITAACAAMLLIGAMGVYLVAKPYQRERIRIELRQALNIESSPHSPRGP